MTLIICTPNQILPRGFIEPILLENSGMVVRPSAFCRIRTCRFLLTQMHEGIWGRVKSSHCRSKKSKELKRNYNKRPYFRSWRPAPPADLARCDVPIFQIIHLGVSE